MKKLTNNIIDQRLVGRNIICLDNYKNSRTQMNFQCSKNKCNYIWKSTINHILIAKTGCPKCSGLIKLTNEDVDARLVGKNIKRLGNYANARTKIGFQCTTPTCKYTWRALPQYTLNKGGGCAKCSGHLKRTNAEFDKTLLGLSIIRVDDYLGANIKIQFKCIKCDNIWKNTPAHINSGQGCPNCSVGKNQQMIFDILKNNKIIFESEKYIKEISYINSLIHIDFYLPKHNTIIEYNGHQHYQPTTFGGISKKTAERNFIEYQQPRDLFLHEFCINNNINLVVIDGRIYNGYKLKQYIIDIIIPQLKEING